MMNYQTARKIENRRRIRLNVPEVNMGSLSDIMEKYHLQNGRLYEVTGKMDVTDVPDPFVTFSIRNNGEIVPSIGHIFFDEV